MKDIYINMNGQNILNYYGTKLDLKIDNSELHDYQISKNQGDFNTDILDISTPIVYSSLVFYSSCLNTPINDQKPFINPINTGITVDNCSYTIQRRTEKGWTLDFVFNRNNTDWTDNNVFYYLGIQNEPNQLNYLDNNLSFSFTKNGEISWEAVKYSGYCDTNTGYTESFYISSGITPTLCFNGTSNDFNITITFDRYKYYQNCDIENMGGQNDMITGYTVTNIYGTITGDTEQYTLTEVLNKKWSDERDRRLGILKIYLNGRPIYKKTDWEEVIPSQRSSLNPMGQIWGGGTTLSGGIHNGTCSLYIKNVEYFEEPLDFVHVRHHYLSTIKPNYYITECSEDCVDILNIGNNNILSSEDDLIILTEDDDIIVY